MPGIAAKVWAICCSISGLPLAPGTFMRTRPGTWCATSNFSFVIVSRSGTFRLDSADAYDLAPDLPEWRYQWRAGMTPLLPACAVQSSGSRRRRLLRRLLDAAFGIDLGDD